GLLLELRSAALRARSGCFAGDDHLAAAFTAPRGNAMSPPQLARDAPVANVVKPIQVDLFVIFGRDRDFAVLDNFNRLFGERLNLDEPLLRETRVDDASATVAGSERNGVILDRDQ